VRRWRRGGGIDGEGGRQTRADDGWRWSERIRLGLPRTGLRSLQWTKRVDQGHDRHLRKLLSPSLPEMGCGVLQIRCRNFVVCRTNTDRLRCPLYKTRFSSVPQTNLFCGVWCASCVCVGWGGVRIGRGFLAASVYKNASFPNQFLYIQWYLASTFSTTTVENKCVGNYIVGDLIKLLEKIQIIYTRKLPAT
jgi:hypothetical protein